MPGSGMDTPSPWRQGPDWEAINITATEKCTLVKARDKKEGETTDKRRECNRSTALIALDWNPRSADNIREKKM